MPAVRREEGTAATFGVGDEPSLHLIHGTNVDAGPSRAGIDRCEGELSAVGRESQDRHVEECERGFSRKRDTEAGQRRLGDRVDGRAGEDAGQDEGRRGRDPAEPGGPRSAAGSTRVGAQGGLAQRLLDFDSSVPDVVEAVPHVHAQAAMKQVAQLAGGVHWQQCPVGLFLQDRRERVRNRLAGKKTLAREHFEQHHAERPDVGALVHRLPPRLLRRHVGGGSEEESRRRRSRRHRRRLRYVRRSRLVSRVRLREAEIEHLDLAVLRELDVRRFQVAVDDALLVSLFEGLGDLPRDLDRFVDRNRSATETHRELLAFNQLEDEKTVSPQRPRGRRWTRCLCG